MEHVVFTGIVRGIGRIAGVESDAARRLFIDTGGLSTDGWSIGDSVAVSGVCLTVAALARGRFEAELSPETMLRTTLGSIDAGESVNIEPAVRATDALGGHLVSGHVDGIATVCAVEERAGSLSAAIAMPAALARFIARKGSVALDGVSLTVGVVEDAEFRIDVVPHTRRATTLGALRPGQRLNVEVDLVARYLDRLLGTRGAP